MQNPFSNPAFSMASLTAAINLIPNRYGRLEALNLFPAKPVRTRQVVIEEYAGRLNLLPTRPPGSPGTVGERGQRSLRSFVVPHIPHDDVVLPEEVQGIRAFGSETEMEAISGVLARHLETMRNKHAITLEHLRMGALKGKILDADGSEIIDLFDAFKIGQTTIPFKFSVKADEGKLKLACYDLLSKMEDGLDGELMTGVHVLCSPGFFRAFTVSTRWPRLPAASCTSSPRCNPCRSSSSPCTLDTCTSPVMDGPFRVARCRAARTADKTPLRLAPASCRRSRTTQPRRPLAGRRATTARGARTGRTRPC